MAFLNYSAKVIFSDEFPFNGTYLVFIACACITFCDPLFYPSLISCTHPLLFPLINPASPQPLSRGRGAKK
jgi:hypothetical protein